MNSRPPTTAEQAAHLRGEQTHRDQPTLAPPACEEIAHELDRKATDMRAMGWSLIARADELGHVARRLRGDK